MRFADKVVIVTGAASGIGAATAERFLNEDAYVVLVDVQKKMMEEKVTGRNPEKYMISETDVSVEKEVKSMISRVIKTFGRIDVLVNNAGIAIMGKILDVSASDWRKQMATNLDGVFYCAKAAMPHLIATGGCIVNTSSVSGLAGDNLMLAYNTSKGGVSNLTRCMAIDYGPQGVRTNAVCPSLTQTGLTEDMMNKKTLTAFRKRMPMGGPAQPEDIAAVIAFLASEDARFINGVNLPVDGGVTASNGQPIYFQ